MATKPRIEWLGQRSPSKVGDWVVVHPALREAISTIVEDRGFIGACWRRFWTVELVRDSPNAIYIKLPESDITVVQRGWLRA